MTVVIGGGDASRLDAELDARAARFPGIIMSSGLAGALDPTLRPGDIVIDGHHHLVAQIAAALPDARVGAVAGSDTIVATTANKRTLAARTGAIAVDMETHVAAQVAARRNLPFVALRVISDDAGSTLPPAALVGMKPDGGMALGAVLRSLARKPGQLPALVRTGNQAGRAFKSLDRAFAALIATGFDHISPEDLPPA
ncbi:phosphorylase family protein [Sphingomonas sp. ERG5]|uniref:phosphorylase family protein n=1 Tax=Sphingomonas sp. ERG5 TaxID=1381597 RepID=UPI001F49283B|nr:phosphorylase [Sphingomonas sp. ERG5]